MFVIIIFYMYNDNFYFGKYMILPRLITTVKFCYLLFLSVPLNNNQPVC